MNLPNKLTLSRVVMIPFFVFFMLYEPLGDLGKYIALGIFAIASLTDLFDGKIARKYNLITNFGKFMDPIADKLLVSSAFICFIQLQVDDAALIPAWAVIVLIAREFVISGFRLVASDCGIVLAASWWGKIKTAVQMIACIFFIVYIPVCHIIMSNTLVTSGTEACEQPIGMVIAKWILVGLCVFLSLISLVDYLVKNRKVISDM